MLSIIGSSASALEVAVVVAVVSSPERTLLAAQAGVLGPMPSLSLLTQSFLLPKRSR